MLFKFNRRRETMILDAITWILNHQKLLQKINVLLNADQTKKPSGGWICVIRCLKKSNIFEDSARLQVQFYQIDIRKTIIEGQDSKFKDLKAWKLREKSHQALKCDIRERSLEQRLRNFM